MEKSLREKAKNFFKYLLELSTLNGKTIRSMKEYVKTWDWNELEKIEGCYIREQCSDESNLLEIHKPNKESPLLKVPALSNKLQKWVNFNYTDETSKPTHHERITLNDENIHFQDHPDIVHSFKEWVSKWSVWANATREYKRSEKIYSAFFDLINELEKDSDTIELVVTKGFIKWPRPDMSFNIELPLFSAKATPIIDAETGIISIKDDTPDLKYESELFTGIKLPNIQKINELLKEIEQLNVKDDLTDLLKQFTNLLDANGQYVESLDDHYNSKQLAVFNHSFLILRQKSTKVLRDDLNQIMMAIDEETFHIPESLRSILGDYLDESSEGNQPTYESIPKSIEFLTPNQLYFPLDSNEQQKDIVNRIEQFNGVTVQGPPGTGKTHTIANLVSHFLAEGKKILITTQKDSPLKVLKNKIPEDIRALCVPVLGGDSQSFNEIEQSISAINEKLGELNTQKLKEEVKKNQQFLHESKKKEAFYRNKLKQYAESEGTPITFRDEQLYKYDVAKRLTETSISYDWILDDVPFEWTFPLNRFEWEDFVKLHNSFEKEYASIATTRLPSLESDILSELDFYHLIKEEENLLAEIDPSLLLTIEDKTSKESLLLQLKSIIENILKQRSLLEDPTYTLIIEDLRADGQRKENWVELIEKLKQANETAFSLYNILIEHTIHLPDKSWNDIQEDLKIAKNHLSKGKKPGMIFYLGKGKTTKYLFQTSLFNGRSVENIEDITIIEKHVEYHRLIEKIGRVFNGHLAEVDMQEIDTSQRRFPHMLEEKLTIASQLIETVQQEHRLSLLIKKELQETIVCDPSYYEKLEEKIAHTLNYIRVEEWQQKYTHELDKLKHLVNMDHMNGITNSFLIAMKEKNTVVWKALISELVELHKVYQEITKWRNYAERLAEKLPLTVKRLMDRFGEVQLDSKDPIEAFELKKLATWLNSESDYNIEALKKQLREEMDLQKKLVQDIVRDATWASQIERITDEEKTALLAWKTFIKRIGKGTGKSAPKYLREARKAMKKAQSSIPVWIMPINQVLQNFPITNEKFDVIIFDESSQCDLFSINVLLRGKKVIVVGDDEQISPQAIGTKSEDVDELVRRYIQNIPNSYLYNGEISLYEIAAMNFPKEGQLMLREHFRCVPEIIQFSNDLSYGGRMIPLRLPLEAEKIEPPVLSIKIENGYTDEKYKDLNIPEADKIVEDILEIIQDPKYEDQTFGVISLQGQRQHKYIETKIREAIGEKEFIQRKVICGNSYTLQGDERDIIFLSMVVAPNRVFRALTKKQDKQRFNVAASRARNQMRLYHSVDIDQLNTNDFRYLFLAYCQHPTRAKQQLETLEDHCESIFEKDVLKMILAKGYRVTPQVVVGQYRIDFVVEGLRDRLAAECDGEKWHGPDKYEEDMKRQESLERAGWKFWRVRGKDFYASPAQAMASLWSALSEMGIEPSVEAYSFSNTEESKTIK
ncbi:AAA domain-containing protein [Rummeliibacillus suwonensis]|uniref:AAA domain-containing protein n=1 Tax=Rummeliibacillus suwonensis TaxID=1306154 RepID=UPI001AAFD3E1|nr:AAA domain-containing protein [Rummeliibacillus suwonensis]MBO2535347.1 DUF559 domain-containing protein [Rummeliibacillus suwonensis]